MSSFLMNFSEKNPYRS